VSAGYNTALTVLAKDGSYRMVAVCAHDSAETIGDDVIAAIHGARLFQLAPYNWGSHFEHLLLVERAAHAATKRRLALAEAELRGENEPDADGESDP
jgi:hypothetical protein